METNQITSGIIGCAIEVHKNTGPGLLESLYEECMIYELREMGLNVIRQLAFPIFYKGIKLDTGYRVDLLVEDVVIVELKSVDVINPVHEAQILTYMKFSCKPIGLLINFNVRVLKNGLRRFRL